MLFTILFHLLWWSHRNAVVKNNSSLVPIDYLYCSCLEFSFFFTIPLFHCSTIPTELLYLCATVSLFHCFTVPLVTCNSRTSGLHVCSCDVSIYCMGESRRLLLRLKISLFHTANQKIELIQKSHVRRALRFLCQGPAALEKRKGLWEKRQDRTNPSIN